MRKIIILIVTTIGSTIIQRNGASNENCIDFSLWKETGILKSAEFFIREECPHFMRFHLGLLLDL